MKLRSFSGMFHRVAVVQDASSMIMKRQQEVGLNRSPTLHQVQGISFSLPKLPIIHINLLLPPIPG